MGSVFQNLNAKRNVKFLFFNPHSRSLWVVTPNWLGVVTWCRFSQFSWGRSKDVAGRGIGKSVSSRRGKSSSLFACIFNGGRSTLGDREVFMRCLCCKSKSFIFASRGVSPRCQRNRPRTWTESLGLLSQFIVAVEIRFVWCVKMKIVQYNSL